MSQKQIQELTLRYRKLSQELNDTFNRTLMEYERGLIETVRQYEESYRRSIANRVKTELDQMEQALKNGNLTSAMYHQMMAETYLSLLR